MGRGRVKRQAVQSEDGWTVITHGLAGLSLDKRHPKEGIEGGKSEKAGMEVGVNTMPDVIDGLTVSTLVSDFKKRQERWCDTECALHLRGLLDKREWQVNKAVCIGIGSFSRDWEHRHRSLWQLVMFVDVVTLLRKQHLEIKMYAQEPAFTPVDIAFLETLDVKVRENDIEMYVGRSTFVYSPFVDWYLLLPSFLRDQDPALYVGNEVLDDYTAYAQTEEKRKKLEECNHLGKKFLEGRDMVKMKEFNLHAHALNGMVVYWKEHDEEKEDNEVVSKDAPT
ncbi:hypothetical protein T440DRAFT_397463 [Plenodomus tracheiphilus IPT5]|uniref:SRR1-like domain-containing protein n=1 Tax=Plenodomus tracheiphilus IPT5 TaxID=1408161 RepID=A0A6A7B499_9PLEO|nr:hypothetical protein T440DRAFT_397463 [Plenodomus tracheiphilus IPT5]